MRACLNELLADGYRKALIVGSDAPTLPLSQIGEALSGLDRAEVVLGPSLDGGFTLIGAARTDPRMFRDVPWSRATTRDQCLRSLRAVGLTAVVAPTEAYDVDTPADLRRLGRDPDLPPRFRYWMEARRTELSEQVATTAPS